MSRLLASGADQDLGPVGAILLQLHLRMCQHCRRYRAELARLAAVARANVPISPERLADLERRIFAAERGETE